MENTPAATATAAIDEKYTVCVACYRLKRKGTDCPSCGGNDSYDRGTFRALSGHPRGRKRGMQWGRRKGG